jgi:hypothetical protein
MSLMVPGTLHYSGYREEALVPPGSPDLCGGRSGPLGLGLGQPKRARSGQRYLAGRNATWIWMATPGAEKPSTSLVL